jgi:hypothetical protein
MQPRSANVRFAPIAVIRQHLSDRRVSAAFTVGRAVGFACCLELLIRNLVGVILGFYCFAFKSITSPFWS